MDLITCLLLALEAGFALWLLWRAGLLKTRKAVFLSALLTAAAFLLRAACLPYETLDYKDFLHHWVSFYRENLGFRSLSYPLGNYNIPYLYFLCFFSYLPIRDLFLIKLLSIFFDVLLAYAAMQLFSLCGGSARGRLTCFFTVLFLPTVVLNGSLWGQCDSIYVALALLGLWLGLSDRPILSAACFALSFGFKLQAVFLLPVMAVLWFRGNYKLWHFAVFPAVYVLLVLPAVLLGKPFLETLTLYLSQADSVGSGLNYNSPSIYAFFWRSPQTADAANLGIVGAFTLMLALLLFCFFRRKRLSARAVIAAAFLFAAGIPFLLPHMHDRYFFGADVLSVVLGFSCLFCIPCALLMQYASLLSYYAYFRMRFLLYVDHGARAVIAALLLGFVQLLHESTGQNFQKSENSSLTKPENLL